MIARVAGLDDVGEALKEARLHVILLAVLVRHVLIDDAVPVFVLASLALVIALEEAAPVAFRHVEHDLEVRAGAALVRDLAALLDLADIPAGREVLDLAAGFLDVFIVLDRFHIVLLFV